MKFAIATLGLVLISSAQAQTTDSPPPAAAKHGGPPVEEIFKKFDTNHDGVLSLEEFKAGHETMHSAMHGPGDKPWAERKEMMAQRMADHFKSLDKNADGKLSKEEVAGTRMASRFDQLDANHDGFVTMDEMKAAKPPMASDGKSSSSTPTGTGPKDHL